MTSTLAAKPPSASRTVMTMLVFPEHANALGNAFGGQVMAWSDMCAGICSMRHAAGTTVTAAVDDMVFEEPIRVGDTVTLEARVNGAFNTSMEVEVEVWGEAPSTGHRWRCVTSRLTFVAIDAAGKRREVPPLLPENDDDARRITEAGARRSERLARRRR